MKKKIEKKKELAKQIITGCVPMRIEFGKVFILISFTNNRRQFLVHLAGWQTLFIFQATGTYSVYTTLHVY